MNSFIYAELSSNSFTVNASGSILGKNFNDIPFKIDTGCSYSTIPCSRLMIYSKSELEQLKKLDIENNISWMTSYGVETGGTPHKKPKTSLEKFDCEAIKFKHKLYDFSIENYNLGDIDIYINYDRNGSILLGMDFLSRFDIHIGYSYKVHKVVFIGVLKEQSDKSDYNKALAEHFGLVPKHSIFASLFRNRFRSQD